MRHVRRVVAHGVQWAMRLLQTACWVFALLATAHAQEAPPAAPFLPIIDAHSQIRAGLDHDRVVRLLKEGRVSRAILSSRFPWTSAPRPNPDPVLELASRYPDLIVPAIGTKGADYKNDSSGWHERMRKMGELDQFQAIGELHIYHKEKRAEAPEIFVMPSDRRVSTALEIVRKRGWPLVLHVEFPNLSSERRLRVLAELKELMRKNPDQPFVLIHMALLEAEDVKALILDHPNIHFITSDTNRLTISRRNPHNFINMFEGVTGPNLQPQWRDLITSHPDRFILGFDNVNPTRHWSDLYLEQIALWRTALSQLPRDVAEAVAHRNAERLWRLAPAQ